MSEDGAAALDMSEYSRRLLPHEKCLEHPPRRNEDETTCVGISSKYYWCAGDVRARSSNFGLSPIHSRCRYGTLARFPSPDYREAIAGAFRGAAGSEPTCRSLPHSAMILAGISGQQLAATVVLCLSLALLSHADEPACDSHYALAAEPISDKPPGETRSKSGPGLSYALLAPDNRVFGAPMPGWSGPYSSAAVVTPAMGAHFAMYIVKAKPGAMLRDPSRFSGAVPGLERFFFVLTGEMVVRAQGSVLGMSGEEATLYPGGFLYAAPGESNLSLLSIGTSGATFLQIDRVYGLRPRDDGKPVSVVGSESSVEVEIPEGEDFRLRRLLNASDPRYDFNVHLMDFHPGEYLAVKERHYNQHGLFMLQGQGLYMLDGDYMPVQAGDVIWMAPFCAQWFASLGKGESRYFIYKDTTVDPLMHRSL